MPENFNYLYQYLEAEQINVNKNEFQFQIQSHPNYPSLGAITDMLSFFSIDNVVLSIESSEIELLPERFAALLEIEDNRTQFYFVERKGDAYFYTKEKNKIILPKQKLISKWKKIVLLVEKSENNIIKKNSESNTFWALSLICILFLFLTLIQFKISILTLLFFLCPIFGILFSIIALKDLFGIENKLINRFCNANDSYSCTTIFQSNKWKIFEVINFSDLSLVFFSVQFFGLITFLLINNIAAYFSIQKTILIGTFPVLLISIYYQKYIAKKWCPICLSIIGLILLESVYFAFCKQFFYNFQIKLLIPYAFIISISTLGWYMLKNILKKQKKLKEINITTNRFVRNYEVFKNNLLASTQIEKNQKPLEETIILGNPEASLKIKFVTSPFCSFCTEAHTVIKEILDKYPSKVCIDVHFNFDEINSDEKSKRIHQQLVSIFLNHGQKLFVEALYNWYEYKDEYVISKINSSKVKDPEAFDHKSPQSLKGSGQSITNCSIEREQKTSSILHTQFKWNIRNLINFTPAIIINGYFLPKYYDKNNLIHFINDLSADEDF